MRRRVLGGQGQRPVQVLPGQLSLAEGQVAGRQVGVAPVVVRIHPQHRLQPEQVVAGLLQVQGPDELRFVVGGDRNGPQEHLGPHGVVVRGVPHADRRARRGVRMRAGIVEGELRPQQGPRGQAHRLRIAVAVLPVELPVVDVQQAPSGRSRNLGHDLHRRAQTVQVGVDAGHVDRDGQDVAVLDDVLGLAGRDVERRRVEYHAQRSPCRRFVREVQSHGGLHLDRLLARAQAELQQEVGARIERPREVRRGRSGPAPAGPDQEVAGREAAVVGGEAGIARGLLLFLEPAPRTGVVQRHLGALQDGLRRRVRSDVHGAHPAGRGDLHRQGEVAVLDAAARRHGVGSGHRNDEVRLSERPVDAGRRRRSAPAAGRGAGRRPAPEKVDVGAGEAGLALEGARAVVPRGLPGGHPPRRDHLRDTFGPRPRLVVTGQAERAQAARPVAADAVLAQQWRHVVVGGRCLTRGLSGADPADEDGERGQSREDPAAHGVHWLLRADPAVRRGPRPAGVAAAPRPAPPR